MLRGVFLLTAACGAAALRGRGLGSDDFSSVDEKLPKRKEYMDSKISIDRGVIQKFGRVPKPVQTSGSRPKVAFLFMLMEEVYFSEVWDKFFAGASQGDYSIYVHRAGVKHENPKVGWPLKQWGARIVPWVNTSWCALFGGEVAMLNHAMQDPLNTQFVFVSHDALPVKSFSYVHKTLVVGSPKTSKFCIAEPASHTRAFSEVAAHEITKGCMYRDFYRAINPRVLKHHQWIVLSREHAGTVLRRADDGLRVWSGAWRQAAPDLDTMGEGCSDEGAPITSLLYDIDAKGQNTSDALSDLAAHGVEENCLTYVHWYQCFHGTEFAAKPPGLVQSTVERMRDVYKFFFTKDFDFLEETSLNDFPRVYDQMTMDQLTLLSQQGFMFARKIDQNVTLEDKPGNKSLADVLPALWKAVDEKTAQATVWKRLQTGFKAKQ